MKKTIVFIFSCLILAQSFAQDARLSGKVVSAKNNEPVAYAAILLTLQADSTNRTGALSSAKGEFDLKNSGSGKYLLRISFLGYKTIVKNLDVASGSIDLGLFRMTRYFYMMLNFRINKAGPTQGRSNPRSTVG